LGYAVTSAKLVVDGKLTVPLFHGTSTLFHSSILETGLGGRNIVEDLGLRALVDELLEYEDQLSTIPNWSWEKRSLLKIAEDPSKQNSTGHVGFSFRYGGTCVTPSRRTAARYALLNDCGSEALARTLTVLDALLVQLPSLAAKEPFSKVLAFGRRARAPILIEAHHVPEAFLRAEQGGPCGPVLESIESALSDHEIYDTMVQQDNFELLCPIPASQLRFYKIVSPRSGHDSLEDLRLEPV
jgi:hypothetical protein